MSFLREFEDDIFISYAHIDNQPLADGQKGWITSFHKALEIRLGQLLGAEPEFWRDESKLRGNDFFDDAIILQLPKVAILIAILTPRYVRSDWCLKEVDEFYRLAEKTGGARLGAQSRVFKVIKTPVPSEQHPSKIQKLLGYEFFQVDPATGKPREFMFNSGPNVDLSYWSKLDDVAYDIFQLLEKLDGNRSAASGATLPATSGSIYLAETTADLMADRDRIKRELQRRGYRVLPEESLPHLAETFEKLVRESLNQCQLSIHLIGASYGVVPEGSERSVSFIQNRLAAERSASGAFSRIIWMPPGMEASEPRQREFITYLCEDPSAQHGAEVLQTSIEDLKTVVLDKIRKGVEVAGHPAIAAGAGPPRIYVISDREDQDAVLPIQDLLFDRGYEVIPSITDGDESQARSDHRDSLLVSDAVLIYQGAAGDAWLRAKLNDLRKLAGYGRTSPLAAKAILIGPPGTPNKQRFRTHEALVIQQSEGFDPGSLTPFINQIEIARGIR